MLGVSSAAAILGGLVSNKVSAVLIGPQGIGLRALLQNYISIVTLVAGFGVGAGLVRLVPEALGAGDTQRADALRRGAWLLTLIFGVLVALLTVALQVPIGAALIGGAQYAPDVALMSFAIIASMATTVNTSILNAHQKIPALARAGILTAVLSTIATVGFIWRFGVAGIPYSVLAAIVVSWIVSQWILRGEVPAPSTRASIREAVGGARDLARFGGSYTASMIVGSGSQMILTVLVAHRFGEAGAGIYRASTVIAVSYLGFLLTAMAQDYFPRLSAAANDDTKVRGLVNDQQTVVMMLAVPVLLIALVTSPLIVTLLYSHAFLPAASLLRWQLSGDLFKFASWPLAYVVLTRCAGWRYFLVELFGGASLLVFCSVLMPRFGIDGIGMGYLVSYASYLLVVWLVVRRAVAFHWTRRNRALLLSAFASIVAVLGAGVLRGGMTQTSVAFLCAIVWGGYALVSVRHDLRPSAAGLVTPEPETHPPIGPVLHSIEEPPLGIHVGWPARIGGSGRTVPANERLRLIEGLGLVGDEWSAQMLALAYDEEQGELRDAVVAAAADCGQAGVATLERALAAERESERALAVEGFAKLGEVERLVPLLHDPSADVALAAAYALARAGHSEEVEDALASVDHGSHAERIREALELLVPVSDRRERRALAEGRQ